MAIYLKKFETQAAYEAAQPNLILPNVSLTVDDNTVHYNPSTPQQSMCVLTLDGGSTINIVGNGEITQLMIAPYSETIISAQITEFCTSIGGRAFQECTSLTSVTIPNSVTTIDDYAFYQCTHLTSVTIPNSVTSIGNYAFNQCVDIESCTIGSGITSIGGHALNECYALSNITIMATTPPELLDYPLDSTEYTTIYVPSESIEEYKTAYIWRDYADSIQEIQ